MGELGTPYFILRRPMPVRARSVAAPLANRWQHARTLVHPESECIAVGDRVMAFGGR